MVETTDGIAIFVEQFIQKDGKVGIKMAVFEPEYS